MFVLFPVPLFSYLSSTASIDRLSLFVENHINFFSRFIAYLIKVEKTFFQVRHVKAVGAGAGDCWNGSRAGYPVALLSYRE